MNNSKDMVAQIYRETVSQGRGNAVARRDAFEEALERIEHEVALGNIEIDTRAAIMAMLVKADESDGTRADTVIKGAARGAYELTELDLQYVVTLGGGMRKTWGFISVDDLINMNETRYQNYHAAAVAYREFRDNISTIRPLIQVYGTFGDAFRAGAFPPVDLFTKKEA
jgi:hypothetical protein